MAKADESALKKRARQLIEEGISINRNTPAAPAEFLIGKSGGPGRPKSNIFEEHWKRYTGKPEGQTDLRIQRTLLCIRHKAWCQIYDKRWKGWPGCEYTVPMPSIGLRDMGNAQWTVYYAAEMAWILMGHSRPENKVTRPWQLKNQDPFSGEVVKFWHSLNKIIQIESLERQGPLPSAEKLFKTTLSAYVARKLLMPKGGHPDTIPTPLHIAQVWYVLFAENEHPDNIKKRLGRVSYYCYRFPQVLLYFSYDPPKQFASLGRALEKKYPDRQLEKWKKVRTWSSFTF